MLLSSRAARFWTVVLALLSAVLLLGQLFRFPSAVTDLVQGGFMDGVNLFYPRWYIALAPFFQAADHFTILSVRQHIALAAFLNALWLSSRAWILNGAPRTMRAALKELAWLLLFNALFLACAATAILVPRPMARLALSDPDLLAVDFHSHTNYSWDARKSFSPAKNLAWHARAGFNAAFITDHNVVEGSREGAMVTQSSAWPHDIRALRGEEVSLHRSHWALLGNEMLVSNAPYDNGMDGIRAFLSDVSRSTGQVAIASLPEYWLYHWADGLETFSSWGAGGFEIANSAPQALEFAEEERKRVVDFCRAQNLLAVGITDTHGWGSTVYVWNLLRVPGWQALSQQELQKRVIETLKVERFNAVRVVARVKAEPCQGWMGLVLDPLRQIWSAARSMPAAQTLITLVWLWAGWLLWSGVLKRF